MILKIPQTTYNQWFDSVTLTGECVEMAYPATVDTLAGKEPVKTLTIHHTDEEWELCMYDTRLELVRVGDEWRLDESAASVRTVLLGDRAKIDYMNNAVVKSIELAAIEAGSGRPNNFKVSVPVRTIRTIAVTARSGEEAIAQVNALIENNINDFEASSELHMPEYDTEDITAGKPAKPSDVFDYREDREHIRPDETSDATLCNLPLADILTAHQEDALNDITSGTFLHDSYCPNCIGELFVRN